MRVNIQKNIPKIMAKLLVDIPDELHRRIKHQAIDENRSVKDLVTDILEKNIDDSKSKDQRNIEKIMGKINEL